MKNQNKVFEKEFFNRIADENETYETIKDEIYNHLTNLLNENIIKTSEKVNWKVLEAGCGTGVFGKKLLEHFPKFNIIGVDISENMIKKADSGTKNYKALIGDLENKDLFKDNEIDIILCPFILHHFPNLEKVFENFDLWLKPGGFLIILEPNGSNPLNKISKKLRKFLEFTLGKEWIIKKKFATPNETDHSARAYKKILYKYNLQIIFIEGNHFKMREIKLFSIRWVKNISYSALRTLFPKSMFSGNSLLIIAIKNIKQNNKLESKR